MQPEENDRQIVINARLFPEKMCVTVEAYAKKFGGRTWRKRIN